MKPERPSQAGPEPVPAELLERLERAYHSAVELGFLGPQEASRLRERHLDDALSLARLRPPRPGEQWVDMGSGAGLPGLPLAAAHPATNFTLVDARRRRLAWVESTAARLGIGNVTVVHARLEEFGRGPARATFDVALARALGPLAVVAELGLPLLRIGGVLIIPRGRPRANELEQLRRAGNELGADRPQVVPSQNFAIDPPGSVVIMTKIAATSPRFPRRPGLPARSPLGQGGTVTG